MAVQGTGLPTVIFACTGRIRRLRQIRHIRRIRWIRHIRHFRQGVCRMRARRIGSETSSGAGFWMNCMCHPADIRPAGGDDAPLVMAFGLVDVSRWFAMPRVWGIRRPGSLLVGHERMATGNLSGTDCSFCLSCARILNWRDPELPNESRGQQDGARNGWHFMDTTRAQEGDPLAAKPGIT